MLMLAVSVWPSELVVVWYDKNYRDLLVQDGLGKGSVINTALQSVDLC